MVPFTFDNLFSDNATVWSHHIELDTDKINSTYVAILHKCIVICLDIYITHGAVNTRWPSDGKIFTTDNYNDFAPGNYAE